MDVVVDLTETGTTLRRNGLKIIGQIMESYTVIIANRDSFEDVAKRRAIEEIVTLLLGVIDARHQVLLSMNVPEDAMERVVAALPALKTTHGEQASRRGLLQYPDGRAEGPGQHPHPEPEGGRRTGHPRDPDCKDYPVIF